MTYRRFKNLYFHYQNYYDFTLRKQTYKDLEEQLGLREKIDWRDSFIPNSEVRDYFCAADLIVQPYKSATQSGVTQVAYHFCKPMLVTNVGGLAEIVPDGKVGYVVEVDAKQVADAISDFVSRGDVDCFQSGILEEKKKYDWARMSAAVRGKDKV